MWTRTNDSTARLALILGMACAGCGEECTDMGCENPLRITLQPNEAWPRGVYAFELETEAGKAACDGALPLPPCGQLALTCTGIPVRISERGCGWAEAEHGFSDIELLSAAELVRLRILRDGELLVDRELRPKYQRESPNGPECGPVCEIANETVPVF